MPRYKTETISVGGDMTWLGSTHSLRNARTETVNVSAFTANTHYPNGYLPSGTPVAVVSGLLVPYDKTEGTTTGAGILAGFVLTDQPVVGTANFAAPVLDHGRIVVANVPYSGGFAAPAAAAKKANTTIVYV